MPGRCNVTTSRKFDDSEGTFGGWQDHPEPCERRDEDGAPCGARVRYRVWESSDGAYEDYQYRCEAGHIRWIDGIDS